MKGLCATVSVAAVLSLPGVAAAQPIQNIALRNSFDPLGAGARGLGMGGAFIAVADDGTAASFNPAGLAQLRLTEIALVGFTETLTSRVGNRAEPTRITHRRPDFAGIAVPFGTGGRHLTVQVSYQRAVDLVGEGAASVIERSPLEDVHPRLPGIEAEFVERVATAQTGSFRTLSLSAGYEMTSRLSIGASANYWLGDWGVRGSNEVVLLHPLPVAGGRSAEGKVFGLEFDQEHSMRAFSLDLGFLLRYPRVSVGGVARLPFSASYSLSESEVTDVLLPDASGRPARTLDDFTVRSQLRWPRRQGIGVAVRPFRGLTLVADYLRSQWSRTVVTDVPGGALLTDPNPTDGNGVPIPTFTNLNFFDLEPASQTETRDTSYWRAGAEYLVVRKKVVVPLRAGVFRDRSPITDLGSDRGRRIGGFTIGSGINLRRLVLDVTFERRGNEGEVGLRLDGQGAPAGEFTRERVRENRVVASLIYRVSSGHDPVRRLLRFLFVGPRDGE